MIVALVGRSCSGKTTLANEMVKHGFKKIITYTTREPREGEEDGTDYHFVTLEEFKALEDKDFFAEIAAYRVPHKGLLWYGSAKYSYEKKDDNQVIVLNPIGIMSVKKLFPDVKVIWLDIPEDICRGRAIKRGDNKFDILDRIMQDNRDFGRFGKTEYYDFRVVTDVTAKDIIDLATFAKEKLNYE